MASKTIISESAAMPAAAFSKEQVLSAKKYADRRDLLAVLLTDEGTYTLSEVDRLINEFMKKEVK